MNKPEFSQQITFLHTSNLAETRHFYNQLLGLKVARDQGTCLIFQVTENAYLGFCEHIEPIKPGRKVILTLVTPDVDGWHDILKQAGAVMTGPPVYNPRYEITHFFLKDPDGYWIEIQRFDDPL